MARLIAVFFGALLLSAFSFKKPVDQIRELYQKSITQSEHIATLKSLTKSRKTPVLRAFYASALAFEARESSWIPNKVSLAKEAYKELNTAVKSDPNNFEIRYLRFSFSCEVPSMLGLSEFVEEDKTYLLNHIKKGEPLASIMKGYFNKSNCLTDAEKKRFASGL